MEINTPEIYFKTFIKKAKFKFIPVMDLKDNSIYGYKIIKDFEEAGYNDKNDVYEMAYDEGVLEFFLLKLQERVYQAAIDNGYGNAKLFHTLRINYLSDAEFFYSSVENLVDNFNLKKENLIFELKGANDWKNLDEFFKYMDDDCVIMFKESKEYPLNKNMVQFLSPEFIEAMSLDSVKALKSNENVSSKIIYKIPSDKEFSNEELLKLGVDFAYKI